jgi:hypothetical protein
VAKSKNPLKGVRVGTAHYMARSFADRNFNGDVESALAEGRIKIGEPTYNKATQKLLVEKRTGRYIIEEI